MLFYVISEYWGIACGRIGTVVNVVLFFVEGMSTVGWMGRTTQNIVLLLVGIVLVYIMLKLWLI